MATSYTSKARVLYTVKSGQVASRIRDNAVLPASADPASHVSKISTVLQRTAVIACYGSIVVLPFYIHDMTITYYFPINFDIRKLTTSTLSVTVARYFLLGSQLLGHLPLSYAY